jgi:hypothetical protein
MVVIRHNKIEKSTKRTRKKKKKKLNKLIHILFFGVQLIHILAKQNLLIKSL